MPILSKLTKWPDYLKVNKDPLTFEQQIKIIDFAYPIRLAAKTYDSVDCPKSWKPEQFGIDPTVPGQMYAANVLIEAIFEKPFFEKPFFVKKDAKTDSEPVREPDYESAMERYRVKLCEIDEKRQTGSHDILYLYQWCIHGDSVQALDPGTLRPTTLDVILNSTYFDTTVTSQVVVQTKNGDHEFKETLTENDREKDRALIKGTLQKLYPEFPYIFDALALTMRTANTKLVFSRVFRNVNTLASGIVGPDVQGFTYNKIVVCSSLNYKNQGVNRQSVGTLIHETLHLLFDQIVKNNESPVLPGQEAELDAAIEQDMQHREKLDRTTLTKDERSVWQTVTILETDPNYTGYIKWPGQLEAMLRAETIVRPMEQIAEGVPEAAVEKVMPNVFRYYKEKCIPLIKEYIAKTTRELDAKLAVTKPDAKQHSKSTECKSATQVINVNSNSNISKSQFDDIFKQYKTTSSFTLYTDHSEAIRNLRCLYEQKSKTPITADDIIRALQYSRRRLNLFFNPESKPNKTKTDDVIVQLRNAFKVRKP